MASLLCQGLLKRLFCRQAHFGCGTIPISVEREGVNKQAKSKDEWQGVEPLPSRHVGFLLKESLKRSPYCKNTRAVRERGCRGSPFPLSSFLTGMVEMHYGYICRISSGNSAKLAMQSIPSTELRSALMSTVVAPKSLAQARTRGLSSTIKASSGAI